MKQQNMVTESKYGHADTPSKLAKLWGKSQEDITAAKSSESWERLIALQLFREDYKKRKKQRLLEEVKNVNFY